MTVYVDAIIEYSAEWVAEPAKKHGRRWCHMWCDGDIEELHAMARKIGLKREWFQVGSGGGLSGGFPHYDLVPSKRTAALKAGAVVSEGLVKPVSGADVGCWSL